MAMNKKEKALLEEARIAAALRWTALVDPDVPPPKEYNELSKGFVAWATTSYDVRVQPACSSIASHGIGSHVQTSSQRPRHLHSKKSLALKNARHMAKFQCAMLLRKFDIEIEKAELEEAGDWKPLFSMPHPHHGKGSEE